MRRSGPESTNTDEPCEAIKADDLERRLRGSSDVQTAQPQPITGTPTDVPVPRNVNETPATAVILHVGPSQATHPSESLGSRFFHLRDEIFTPKLIVFK
jgi:hypothetical protein